jgi:transposase-like protein
MVIEDSARPTLVPNIEENVEKGATVYSDELKSYFGLCADYAHAVINHTEMYVNGQVHLNGLENFWSLLKRGLGGTYASVEPFHLYNHRRNADGSKMSESDRFNALCSQMVGRRLTYKQLTGKENERPEDFYKRSYA